MDEYTVDPPILHLSSSSFSSSSPPPPPPSSVSSFTGTGGVSSSVNNIEPGKASLYDPAIWDFDMATLELWVKKSAPLHADFAVADLLWTQFRSSIESLRETVQIQDSTIEDIEYRDEVNGDSRKRKWLKKTSTIRVLYDPNHLWIPVWKECPEDGPSRVLGEDADDIPSSLGGKISQLSLGGLLNALAGIAGGVTHQTTPSLAILIQASTSLKLQFDVNVLYETAVRLHRAIATRIQVDVLRTTPLRIQDMLASELTAQEFSAIKKRIVDTVVRGKGRAILVDEYSDDLVVAPPAVAAPSQSTAEQNQKCKTCGNQDQATFILDRKNGDLICSNCGTVVSESIMHEGSQYRKFEGEIDRNHHGDSANPLFSNAQNMSTTLGGVITSASLSRGMGGKSNLETILRNAHSYTELNLSNFGKNDRRTRTGYKDKQKKDAFVQMAHAADALNLHDAVIQRAKELFAGFRDDRELIQQFKGVIGACLSIAFEQLSEEGKMILKSSEQADVSFSMIDYDGKQRALSSRAVRRNQLHHASLAGKGGLLLDFSNTNFKGCETPGSASSASASNKSSLSPILSEKSISSWTLDDCRAFLLDASRRIAQQWIGERDLMTPTSMNIPAGTFEELEGHLVEYSISLCEQLEKDMNDVSFSRSSTKKVTTPRVENMSKLGIKWQHSHERGSGGKGGVGGSGSGTNPNTSSSNGRSAGQILILKTSKKLGECIGDFFAGEAFHKELRGLIAQQETKKRQMIREQASRQRLQQMKRKPWLQAKIEA